MRTTHRCRGRGQAGTTAVELVVAMALMLAVVPIVGPVLVNSFRAATRADEAGSAMTELRLASHSISRGLRGAECVLAPAPGAGAGNGLSFETAASGITETITYSIDAGRLVRSSSLGPGPKVIAEGLVEPNAFTHLDSAPSSIAIELVVVVGDLAPRTLSSTVTGRNAWNPSC